MNPPGVQELGSDPGLSPRWLRLTLGLTGVLAGGLLVALTWAFAYFSTWSALFAQMWIALAIPLILAVLLAVWSRRRPGAVALGARCCARVCGIGGTIALTSMAIYLLIDR